MAVVLDSQASLRAVRRLPFCYLCTHSFIAGQNCNDDHVPPYALFNKADRDFPLILRTHKACNQSRSAEDQVISQLVGLLHGRAPVKGDRKIPMRLGTFLDGSEGVGTMGVDLPGIVKRWVRGFHAALYSQPLAADSDFATSLPFPEGRLSGGTVEAVPVQPVIAELVGELKRNRATATLDRVLCRNGKCRYECVWAQSDRGEWGCIYCLDVYEWRHLGDTTHFEPRGCVGWYRPATRRVPRNATCGTRLHFSVENVERLNPFGN